MSKANSAGNMYDQERIHKFLQNRYLKIDFLTLYRVNLLKASGKVKRKYKNGKHIKILVRMNTDLYKL